MHFRLLQRKFSEATTFLIATLLSSLVLYSLSSLRMGDAGLVVTPATNDVCAVTFIVVMKETLPGENVAIVGSSKDLGEWKVKNSVFLETNPTDFPEWSVRMLLPQGSSHEYKYLVVTGKKENPRPKMWETHIKNRSLSVPFGTAGDAGCIVVRDGVFGSTPDEMSFSPGKKLIPRNLKTKWIDWGWLTTGVQLWISARRTTLLEPQVFNSKVFALPVQSPEPGFYFEVRELAVGEWIVDAPSLEDLSFFVDFWPGAEVHSTLNLIGRVAFSWKELKRRRGRFVRPILCPPNLYVVGEVECDFLVGTPFYHPENSVRASYRHYWRSRPTLNIGHRGMGTTGKSLSIVENTMLAFESAPKYGASYVEMDIIVTNDLVPVIAHDFTQRFRVSEKDCSPNTPAVGININSLTWEVLKLLRPIPRNVEVVSSTPADFSSYTMKPWGGKTLRRSHSAGDLSKIAGESSFRTNPPTPANASPRESAAQSPTLSHLSLVAMGQSEVFDLKNLDELHQRLRLPGLKPRARRGKPSNIRDRLASLREVLERVPETLGFNLEVKYPLNKNGDSGGYVERNSLLDAILQVVFDYAGSRRIVFSSFDANICLLLSVKQARYPVFILTVGGTERAIEGDPRLNNLEEATDFATTHRLRGVVSESTPLIANPETISKIKSRGLTLFSYGRWNNVYENCEIQRRAGVDAIISDNPATFSEEGIMELMQRVKHRDRQMKRLSAVHKEDLLLASWMAPTAPVAEEPVNEFDHEFLSI